MATNQEKLDKIYDTSVVADKKAFEGSMDFGNYKVKENATGRMVSLFDGARDNYGLHTPIDWKGFDGKTPTQGRKTTTIATDVAYNDTRFADINRKLDTVIETLKALALSTGAVIDYDEIARKVNDEADRRDRDRLAITTTEEN